MSGTNCTESLRGDAAVSTAAVQQHDQRQQGRAPDDDDGVSLTACSKPSLHSRLLQQNDDVEGEATSVIVVEKEESAAEEEESTTHRDDQSSARVGGDEAAAEVPRQPASPDRDPSEQVVKEAEKALVESAESVKDETVEADTADCVQLDFSSLRVVNLLLPPSVHQGVDDNDEDLPLTHLENVTAQSRSFIPRELLRPPLKKKKKKYSMHHTKMTTPTVPNTSGKRRGLFRKRSSNSKKRTEKRDDAAQDSSAASSSAANRSQSVPNRRGRSDAAVVRGREASHRYSSLEDTPSFGSEETPIKSNQAVTSRGPRPPRPGIVERIRSASRSRSRSRRRTKLEDDDDDGVTPILVAVTSCRSDAYYNQKAPGSTSKLPRKAPSNLKLFHELAVGVKDAYVAVGETPTRPDDEADVTAPGHEGRMVLWEFMGNLDFVSIV